MYIVYAYNKRMNVAQVATSVPYGCHIAMAIVMALQTSWFVLFCRGFIKLLTKPSKYQKGVTEGDANGYTEANKQKDDWFRAGTRETIYPRKQQYDTENIACRLLRKNLVKEWR